MQTQGDQRIESLTARLARERLMLRLLLVSDAVLRCIPIACAVIGVGALLDWWVRFPAIVRAILAVTGVMISLRWAYRRIWRPAVSNIPLDQLAIRLTGAQPELRDKLAGAAAYLRGGGAGSPTLWGDLVSHAGDDVPMDIFESHIRRRRLLVRAIVAAVAIAGAAAAMSNIPGYVETGLRRYSTPFAAVNWPKRNLIEPMTRSSVVPKDEPFTMAMRLRQGDHADFRAYVAWQAEGAAEQRALMRRDGDGIYRFTLDRVNEPLKYHFIAGDDDTGAKPFRVRLAVRPTVASVKATVSPPVYVKQAAAQTHSILEEEITVIESSRIRLEITTNKPLGDGTNSRALAELLEQERERHSFDRIAGATNAYALDIIAAKSAEYRVHLEDADGLESAGDPVFRIAVKPDEPPGVSIVGPSLSMEVTPQSKVQLAVVARDDLGVDETALYYLVGEGPRREVPALSKADEAKSGGSALEVQSDYELDLASAGVNVGDVIRCYAEARDSYVAGGKRREPVRSAEHLMRVVSAVEMVERLGQRLQSNRQRLYKIMADLAAIRDRTRQLNDQVAAQQYSNTASGLADDLAMLINAVRETARNFEEVGRSAEAHSLKQANIGEQARRASKLLEHEAKSTLAHATSAVVRAASAVTDSSRHEAVDSSIVSQQAALDALGLVARQLEESGRFHELIARVQELLDRQEAVSREAQAVIKAAAGGAVSELDSSLKQRQLSCVFAQLRVRDDSSQVLDAMAAGSVEGGSAGVATRQSIEAAVQLARERTLIVHMEQASEALRELRQADVSEHQGAAVSCLRAMIVALNERPQRELAELSRMLQDLVGRLARIVEAHEALMERTREGQAHPPSVEIVVSLADRQLSLAKTTIALYGELTLDEPLARRAAEELASADQLMRKAEGLLRKRALVDAMPAQIEAHAGLKEALALLQRLDESAQQRLADHSLDVLLNGLRELKGRQLAIRGETGQVGKKMHGKSRVSKADGLAFNQLAAQQKELIPLLEELRKKMDMSIVYAHVCRRIGVHMTEAAAGLTHRDAVTALIKQDEVLRQLSRLIESAEIKPPSKNREFVENQSGGGSGASSPTISKPIPTLAELKILRALQGDLSDQTVEVNRRLPEPIMRTEGQLKEVESLGVAQRELRELAVKMLEKAADGGGRR